MSTFQYQAMTKDGGSKTGFIEAENAKQARDKLRNEGLFPMTLESCDGNSTTSKKSSDDKSKFSFTITRKVKFLDISLVTRQLATLIAAGLPLADCLKSVIEQCEKKQLRSILAGVRSRVTEGYSLADSLKLYPQAFNHLYCATIAAGEQTGRLDIILEQLADYIESQVAMRNKILQALVYPAAMLFMSIAIVIFLLSFVVPKIIDVFTSTGQLLPKITRVLLFITDWIKDYGLYTGLGAAMAFLLFLRLLKNPKFLFSWHRFLLKLPMLGFTIKHINTARYAKTFGMLLHAGTPVTQAMNIAASLIRNGPMHDKIGLATNKVQEGVAIHKSLKETGYFPSMTLHLIANGENTGKLEAMLERAANNQEQEVKQLIETLLTLFEPIIIITMGAVVLFIVLAVLLPIFEMNQLV